MFKNNGFLILRFTNKVEVNRTMLDDLRYLFSRLLFKASFSHKSISASSVHLKLHHTSLFHYMIPRNVYFRDCPT